MSSIVAGSTYLLAPPPPKSISHNHLLASLPCHPISHPHLLLQFQRKDPDSRHAFPQFDLVCRKASRPSKQDQQNHKSSVDNLSHRPREVAVQQSETAQRIALIKYVNTLSAAQKRRLEIAVDDDSTIAIISWKYNHSLIREWSVHRYDQKRKSGGSRNVGYEFRLRNSTHRNKDGNGPSIRWTKKVIPPGQERSQSMMSPTSPSRRRRSRSVSSIEMPVRRYTMPSTPGTPATTSEPKWEFSSPNCRRLMATMTSKKLHIHSISSSATPSSSPTNSECDFDDEFHSDRELTTGRMLEFLIVSSLFVGLEENFASKLRSEYLSAPGRRCPPQTNSSNPLIHPPHPNEFIRSAQIPPPPTSILLPPRIRPPLQIQTEQLEDSEESRRKMKVRRNARIPWNEQRVMSPLMR